MIIWSNGCFDVLHLGHVCMLEYAKKQGSRLFVGLDTDERVRLSKGRDRPYNCLEHRMKVVSSLRCVDRVVSFGTDDELLSEIKKSCAELIVVGDDYRDKKVIGADIAPVHFFPKLQNLSSSEVINALRV